jgi:hypothetical protein
MSRATRKFCALQLVGNALLLWLAYFWLSLNEATTLRFAALVIAALAMVLAAACLHGATFVSFRQGAPPGVGGAFRTVLRHLLPVLAIVLLGIAVYVFLDWWEGYSFTPAARLASWLTLTFRKPVKPDTIKRYFDIVLWILRWALIPCDLLPLFSGVSTRGWRGFNEFGWRRYSRLYRLEVPVLALTAVWVPLWLVNWVPDVKTFNMELLSFAARILAAYLLFVTSAILLAFLTSRGKPSKV